MPTIPRGFMPSAPTPVYFAPDIVGGFRGGRKDTLARRQLDISEQENVFKRESAQEKAKKKQDEAERDRQGMLGGSMPDGTSIADFTTAAGGTLTEEMQQITKIPKWQETLRMVYGVKPEPYKPMTREQQFADLREKTEITQKPSESWGKPYKDDFGNFLQKSSTGQVRRVTAPPRGMEITTADGTTIRTGVPSGGMQKKTLGAIEQKIFDAKEARTRHANILEGFKPEYFEIESRIGMEWAALKDKSKTLTKWFGGVDPKIRSTVREYSTYRKKALREINAEIKRITGAQMSEKEAKRLRGGMPDFGEGLIPPDSASEFYGATVDTIKEINAAIARYHMYVSQGLKHNQIIKLVNDDQALALDRIPEIMREQEEKLKAHYKQQGQNAGQIADSVRSDLTEMFGL